MLFQDCEKTSLSKIAQITMGQSPSGNSLNDNKNGMIFYQGRTDFGFRYPSIRLYTNEPKRIAKKGDILLSVRAPVGDVGEGGRGLFIQRVVGLQREQKSVLQQIPQFLPILGVYLLSEKFTHNTLL